MSQPSQSFRHYPDPNARLGNGNGNGNGYVPGHDAPQIYSVRLARLRQCANLKCFTNP